jgi:hypothetical protein
MKMRTSWKSFAVRSASCALTAEQDANISIVDTNHRLYMEAPHRVRGHSIPTLPLQVIDRYRVKPRTDSASALIVQSWAARHPRPTVTANVFVRRLRAKTGLMLCHNSRALIAVVRKLTSSWPMPSVIK